MPQSDSLIGFARHVPTELSDTELDNSVQSVYPEARCERLKKKNQSLQTVKITFSEAGHLKQALDNGIQLEHLAVKVELPTVKP